MAKQEQYLHRVSDTLVAQALKSSLYFSVGEEFYFQALENLNS